MLQKSNILSIANVFFSEPTKEHYLKEISEKTGIAHTSVKNYLSKLKKESLINEIIIKRGQRKFPTYTSRVNSEEYIKNKKSTNLIKLQESGLIEYLNDKLMPKCIVLFGSYQKGEDLEESDIDVFIECKKEDIDLSKFAKKLKRNIQLHFKDNFKDYPIELKNNIINGTTLAGYLEAFK
jgi:predicted nucleotidyltransferase